MPRTSPVRTLANFVAVMACWLVAVIAWAKPAPDLLVPTRARLDALQGCLGPNPALTTLRKGLLWGWRAPEAPPTLRDRLPAPPPPLEYLETLDRDLKACEVASHMVDEEQRRLVLASVEKDIEIKARDCRKFGMGRKVPVRINTLRGNQPENGWQVFYKWSCASLLQPQEVRAPNLTSPALLELPPGLYSVRAEKSVAPAQSIAPVTVMVGSAPSIPIELAIQ